MIGKIIKNNDLIIYESTVYPGCVEEVCVPVLEKFSKLRFNVDFFAVIVLSVLTLEIKIILFQI